MRSPCQNLCLVEKHGHYCLGCYRTLEEISLWTRYSDEERDAIITTLDARKRQMTAKKDPCL